MSTISFEDWVKDMFDHPEAEKHWAFSEVYLPNEEIVSDFNTLAEEVIYVTRLFNSADEILKSYSNWQVAQGIDYIVNPSIGDVMRLAVYPHAEVVHPHVEVEQRLPLECIPSVYSLYEKLFAVRCQDHLSHLDRETTYDRLNGECYMLWDVLPIHGQRENPIQAAYDQACLDVMTKVLQLDSMACRESALHGLGHWFFQYRELVPAIIQQFIDHNPDLDPDLKHYAVCVQRGRVL